MDYSTGRGSPANLPTMDFTPDNPARENRADFSEESRELGAPMRRLERDLGLQQGYLAIRERGPSNQTPDYERARPAPYYPQEEPRQNPRPGTIPVMPDRRYVDQGYRQQGYDQRFEEQRYYDERQQQRYYEQRSQEQRQQRPGQCLPQRPCDNRRPQYIDQRNQNQTYDAPAYVDPRGYRPYVDDERYQDRRYYDNRYQDQRYYDNRYRDEGDYYKDRWRDQSQYPNPGRFQPSRNPELDRYRQEWWNQTEIPMNPGDRYQPSRNPELDRYRREWWQNAQRPPAGDNRFNRYPPQYRDNGYQQPDGYYRDRTYNQSLEPNMIDAMNYFMGRGVPEFDRAVPARLGCARAVSLVLERTYGIPMREQGCEGLEQRIQQYGWVQVDPRQMQAGDVIIGQRAPGEKGHAAIYVGNDQIYNNNSNSGVMQVESLNKFRSREFIQVRIYRKAR